MSSKSDIFEERRVNFLSKAAADAEKIDLYFTEHIARFVGESPDACDCQSYPPFVHRGLFELVLSTTNVGAAALEYMDGQVGKYSLEKLVKWDAGLGSYVVVLTHIGLYEAINAATPQPRYHDYTELLDEAPKV